MDEPPVMVAELLAGCICDPEPGDYELRVFCRVGDGEITLVVDEDTVPGDWDCVICSGSGCDEWFGRVALVTIIGSGDFSVFNGTYSAIVNGSCLAWFFHSIPNVGYVAFSHALVQGTLIVSGTRYIQGSGERCTTTVSFERISNPLPAFTLEGKVTTDVTANTRLPIYAACATFPEGALTFQWKYAP